MNDTYELENLTIKGIFTTYLVIQNLENRTL